MRTLYRTQPSILPGFTVIQTPPQARVPALDTGQEKFNSRLVSPTPF